MSDREEFTPEEQLIPASALKPRPYVSYSEWMMFRNLCQQRWKLDYVEARRAKIYSIHMDFGTAIHGAIENWKTRNGPALSKEGAFPFFEELFKNLYEENKKFYKEKDLEQDPQFFIDAGKTIIERFEECKELASAEVVYNEYELFLPIERTDPVEISFKGYIDMVIKTVDGRGKTCLYVCDFKSCSWGWPIEKKQDKDLHYQILLYKYFLCKKFNLDPKQVRTAFVLLKKRPRGKDSPVEFFPISAGPVSVQRALDELNKDITKMSEAVGSGLFEKNRKSCVSKFGDTCPYKDTEHCTKD